MRIVVCSCPLPRRVFDLLLCALWWGSQSRRQICDKCLTVAMFSLHLKRGSVVMKKLKNLLGMIGREPLAKTLKPTAQKRLNGEGDFRAVEISPRVLCCEEARRVAGKRYLLGKAPRMPLMGCTTPTTCSCTFLKSKDRRDGDRRLLGAVTSRWFRGVESRKYVGRRLAER
jgi:hypothetical protein